MSPIVVAIDGYHRGRQLGPPAFDLFEQLLVVQPVMLMCSAMTEMGHFDPFPPPGLNGRCPLSWPTSAGESGIYNLFAFFICR